MATYKYNLLPPTRKGGDDEAPMRPAAFETASEAALVAIMCLNGSVGAERQVQPLSTAQVSRFDVALRISRPRALNPIEVSAGDPPAHAGLHL